MENSSDENINDTNSLEKPPVSDRKREANRQNAQKSTGPKTDAGKERSSRNATKHGMWSDCDTQLYGEDPQDFLQKHAALREYYQPVGPLEEFEVERIAQMQRRMERATRFEHGCISLLQLDIIRWKELMQRNLHETITRVQEIISNYPKLKRMLEEGTPTPPTDEAVSEIEQRKQTKDCNQETKPVSPAEKYQSFIHQNHSRRSELAELDKASLPKAEDMNIVLRADSAAEKSLARAIKRLEELQAKRKEKENTYKVEDWADSDEVVAI